MPAQIVSHYRILGRLGSGGMGVVYRAEDTTLRRTVALKFLSESSSGSSPVSERLRDEARAASALNHPNICTIYEIGEDAGEVFIAMECIEGRTLAEIIQQGPLPIETVLRYGRQLASALAHAHDRGVIHGDFKPQNVIVTPGGDAKILDFGLARRRNPSEFDQQTLETISGDTRVGLGGTLPYMAPEQIGGGEITPRTDIWSLGIVLYEMATGIRPFVGDNLYLLCTSILRDAPSSARTRIPPGLDTVISQCLEKEPARRYQRASETRAALETLSPSAEAAVPPAPHTPPTESTEKPGRRWMKPAAAVALVILAGMIAWRGGWIRTRSASGAVPSPILLGVLPPVSGDASEAAFATGLADTLNARLGDLSKSHPVGVIPMYLTMEKHVNSVDEARQEFGVNLVLVLKVQRAAENMRVNYALVDSRSHQQVGGGTVTAAASDPFALQDLVVESVAASMELRLAPQEKKELASHGTVEPAAYDYYMQGRGYLQDYVVPEKVESAITLFGRAIEKDPAYAAATAGLGEAYWRKFQLTHDSHWADVAVVNCQRAAALAPRLSAAHACLGRVYSSRGEYEKAADQYRRAIELEPTSDGAYGGLATAYERMGRPEEAEREFNQAIAMRPGYWATYNWLGLFYMDHAKYEDASKMFEQVIALAPDSFTGYYNLGGVRVLQGKYGEAVPLLERSLSIRPTGDAYSNLATAYFQMHRYGESAENFEKAVKLDAKSYMLWGNLGDAYYWAPGRRPEAAAAYGTAISLGKELLEKNPRDAQVLSSLAMYYAMRGERQPALADLNAALRLQPKEPNLQFNAAIVYQQLGDTRRALDSLEKAVQLGVALEIVRDTPNFDGLRDNPRFAKLVQNDKTK